MGDFLSNTYVYVCVCVCVCVCVYVCMYVWQFFSINVHFASKGIDQ